MLTCDLPERSQGRLKADRSPRYIPHQEISTQIIVILKSHPGMIIIVILTIPLKRIFKK